MTGATACCNGLAAGAGAMAAGGEGRVGIGTGWSKSGGGGMLAGGGDTDWAPAAPAASRIVAMAGRRIRRAFMMALRQAGTASVYPGDEDGMPGRKPPRWRHDATMPA